MEMFYCAECKKKVIVTSGRDMHVEKHLKNGTYLVRGLDSAGHKVYKIFSAKKLHGR